MFGIVGASLLAVSTAHADRSMVVLLDATGSMQAVRSDGDTRYQAAVKQARSRVFTAATMEAEGLVNVAVLQFNSSTGTISLSGGTATNPTFVPPFAADGIIASSSVSPFATPLADALCDTIDAARVISLTTTDRLIEAFTDGAENSSDLARCGGPNSTTGNPFDDPSWQHNVLIRATDPTKHAVQINTTLYTDVTSFGGGAAAPPEVGVLAAASRSLQGFISDQQFFGELTVATGGTFTVLSDAAPPVFADVDADGDVDRSDALALARRFGEPATSAFDLNRDGSIGFDDYRIVVSRMTRPDPYHPAAPIKCTTEELELDGVVIESAGAAVEVRGWCRVKIKNSLIVGGQAAVKLLETGVVSIENSIVVGAGAAISVPSGNPALCTLNTLFDGRLDIIGSLYYHDLGGTIFE